MKPEVDSECIERFLKRCILKRGDVMTQMKTLYDLALTVELNPDVAPIFCERKRQIEILVTEFNVEHNSVLDNLLLLSREDEFTDSHLSLKTTFMEQYYYIIALDTRLQLDPRPPAMEAPASNVKHLTLPKTKLPIFGGDLLKWRTYRDTFASLVHNNQGVSKIEKFHHLLSSTAGAAGSVVRSLSLTEDNYDIVSDNLHTMYDNKRVLMTAHLDAIFHFAPLAKESLSNLKSFLATFQEKIAAIKTLKSKIWKDFYYFTSRQEH